MVELVNKTKKVQKVQFWSNIEVKIGIKVDILFVTHTQLWYN